jgi:hypothetical protein
MRELVFTLDYGQRCDAAADTLADRLGVPRSTLNHRLRRVEVDVVEQDVGE